MHLSSLKLPRSKKTPLPWWVKIQTTIPNCLYYFGPFDSETAAKRLQSGYVEDLLNEKAEGIDIEIKQCHPETLTQFLEI